MIFIEGIWAFMLTVAGIYIFTDAVWRKNFVFAGVVSAYVAGCYIVFQQTIADKHGGYWLRVAMRPLIALSLALVFIIAFTYIRRSRRVTSESVREGIDVLTDGLCYYNSDGRIILVNPAMNVIAADVLGKSVTDGNEFYEWLRNGKAVNATFLQRGATPTVRLSQGRVYRIVHKERTFFEDPVTEIVASDITDEYAARVKLRERNEYITRQRARLLAVNDTITDLTIEKEILQTKVNIHDDLGKALVAARSYLNGNTSKEELMSVFDTNIALVASPDLSAKRGDDYSTVLKAAKDVGINIVITGQLPEDADGAKVVSSAMRECITNTFRHAGGDELYIDIYDNEHGETVVRFTNNGTPPRNKITETGGLKYLRKIAEQKGALMSIESVPEFVLTITLLKKRMDDYE